MKKCQKLLLYFSVHNDNYKELCQSRQICGYKALLHIHRKLLPTQLGLSQFHANTELQLSSVAMLCRMHCQSQKKFSSAPTNIHNFHETENLWTELITETTITNVNTDNSGP